MMKTYIATFESTHHVLTAEKKLKPYLEDITTIPTPEELSVNCGISLQIKSGFDYKRIKSLFSETRLKYDKLIESSPS